jgi:hypothetical protein
VFAVNIKVSEATCSYTSRGDEVSMHDLEDAAQLTRRRSQAAAASSDSGDACRLGDACRPGDACRVSDCASGGNICDMSDVDSANWVCVLPTLCPHSTLSSPGCAEADALLANMVDGVLVIPPDTYGAIGKYTFYRDYRQNLLTNPLVENIVSVAFADSVLEISAHAFECLACDDVGFGVSLLRSLTFGAGSRLHTIGERCFAGALVGAFTFLPASVVAIGPGAFCRSSCGTEKVRTPEYLAGFGPFGDAARFSACGRAPALGLAQCDTITCPMPARCVDGDFANGCVTGAGGLGCSMCEVDWFSTADRCDECPEGGGLMLPIVVGLALIIAVGAGVWRVVAKPEHQDAAEDAEGKVANVNALRTASTNAAMVGIGAFHLQISAINLNIPSFPFPEVLRFVARWVMNIVGFDFGAIGNVECQGWFVFGHDTTGTKTLLVKLFLANGTAALIMLALWGIGKKTCQRNRARNAMVALYTLLIMMLMKTSLMGMDCTDGYLDYQPQSKCEKAGYGASWVTLVFHGLCSPLLLLWVLARGRKREEIEDDSVRAEQYSFTDSFSWGAPDTLFALPFSV